MGIISAIFNFISKAFKYLVVLLIFFVAVFIFGKKFSGGGSVKKGTKTKSYYEVKVKNYETKEPFQINFVNDSKLILDGVEYSYNITETLGSTYYGYGGFELSLQNTSGEKKHIRIVRGTLNQVTEGPTYEFIKRRQITDNAKYYKEIPVKNDTNNKDILDGVFTGYTGHNGFAGVIW